MRLVTLLAGLVAALAVWASPAQTPADYRAGAERFADEMVRSHGLPRAEIAALVAEARYRQEVIDAIRRPWEAKPWHQYRKLFLTDARIEGGAKFMREHADLLNRAQAEYGVPAEVITAILGVETNYGGNLGRHRVLDALTTLGFAYPPRADFFRKELAQFALLVREEAIDPAEAVGSYAGAMGRPQFIPSSYRAYAVDFDGDGRRDLWDTADAIGSVANYFKRHGWRTGEPVAVRAEVPGGLPPGIEAAEGKPKRPDSSVGRLAAAGIGAAEALDAAAPATLIRLEGAAGDEYWVGLENFYVITRYNHSNLYAMAVHQLSGEIRKAAGSRSGDTAALERR
jgi:membrane-bound lytic murein transglycosylase B